LEIRIISGPVDSGCYEFDFTAYEKEAHDLKSYLPFKKKPLFRALNFESLLAPLAFHL